MSQEQVESASALAWEVMTYQDYVRSRSIYARERYLQELSLSGWSHSQLGALFGLTKQRVQQLLKQMGHEKGQRRRPGIKGL